MIENLFTHDIMYVNNAVKRINFFRIESNGDKTLIGTKHYPTIPVASSHGNEAFIKPTK